MSRRVVLLLAGGSFALAVGLRVHDLGAKSIWYDESISIHNAMMPFGKLFGEVARTDTSPPFYFTLLWIWVRVFGDTEAGVRSLSVALDAIGLLLLFVLALRAAGPAVACLSLALAAVSLPGLRFAQEARMYCLLVPLCLGSQLGYWVYLQEGRRRGLAIWFACTVGAVYTHHYGWFVLGAQLVHHIVSHRRRWFVLPVGVALVTLLYLPWAFVLLQQVADRAGGKFWIGAPDVKSVYHVLWTFASSSKPLAILCSAAIGFGLLRRLRVPGTETANRREPELFLLLWLIVPLALAFSVSHMLMPIFVARYFLPVIPAFWMLVALGVVRLPFSAALPAAAVVVALNVPGVVDWYRRPHKTQWREAALHIRDSPDRGELILMTGGIPAFRYYYHYRYRQGLPVRGAIGGDTVHVDLTSRELRKVVGSARRFWFLWTQIRPPDSQLLVRLAEFCDLELRGSLWGVSIYLCRTPGGELRGRGTKKRQASTSSARR